MPLVLSRRSRLLAMLAAVPFVVGSSCVVLFSSGDSDDDDKDDDKIVVTGQGSFVDSTVVGMAYQSGELSGVTDGQGDFSYQEGKQVRFAIGDIPLGEPVDAADALTPLDLVPGGDANTRAVINIARLLQSLDSDPGDNTITIPAEVAAKATRDNPAVAAAIEFLDFNDDAAFANSASQLVAVLTADYPFTASLVDAETARSRLLESANDSAEPEDN